MASILGQTLDKLDVTPLFVIGAAVAPEETGQVTRTAVAWWHEWLWYVFEGGILLHDFFSQKILSLFKSIT